jgi:signal transduction histidine kinase
MNRADALIRLTSEVPADRLEAARYLQFWALPGDIPTLRSALARESVGWIRRAIRSALSRLGDRAESEIDLENYLQDESEQSREASSLARGHMARTLVHELEPIVGTMQYYAMNELREAYEVSRTKDQIDRLGRFLRAIESLGQATGTPKPQAFDLRLLLTRLIDAEQTALGAVIRLSGPAQATITSDPGLVEIVVANALRNASEAVSERATSPELSVVYGISDIDFWINIRDNGRGLPSGSTERLFDLGTSTKDGHLGMGLALSVEAARSLRGDIKLSGSSEGTSFEATFSIGRA